MKTIFLDVETTGIEEKDRLCQLAYHTKGEKTFVNALFKPVVPMTIEAMSVCHITDEMLKDKPPFFGSAIQKELSASFTLNDTVMVAHNAQFDMGFLAREGVMLPLRHVCTMKISHHHDKEGKLAKNNLQYLRYFYGLKFAEEINPHDAYSDIIVLEALYDFYSQFYSADEMVEISQRPILLKKMPFGKYKGEWLKDIGVKDYNYLQWLKREVKDMDENLKYTVEYYLKNTKR